MAPEVHAVTADGGYDGKCADVYSCGVLLYWLLYDAFPWIEGNNTPMRRRPRFLRDRLRAHEIDFEFHIPLSGRNGPVSEAARNLLAGMLKVLGIVLLSLLPSTSEILLHKFIVYERPSPTLPQCSHFPDPLPRRSMLPIASPSPRS